MVQTKTKNIMKFLKVIILEHSGIYCDLCDEEEVTCEDCGTTFAKISDGWYYDCKAKIVSLGKNCH